MMLSVIIPTCDRNELLSRCLDQLAPGIQSIAEEMYEVIVTDDSKASAAESLIQSNYTWVRYIKGPVRGPAANRNNGSKHANAGWLVFVDDDCIPDKNLLNEYLNGINSNPSCLAFEGAIYPDDENLLQKDMAECPVNTNGGCFWSANICVNAKLFKEIGGFDEDFIIAAQEDQFLYYLLKQRTAVEFLPAASVTHAVRFVALNKKLNGNITAVKNWLLYSKKKGIPATEIIKTGYRFQCTSLFRNIKSLKIKSIILNIHTIIIALPFVILNNAKSKLR
ncbi:MAG TPA: glycosyltransferase family A protein [Parafilimonas sp.]|nr:glycosyltransferase family A protein [Parafilimonas sp.]